MSRFNQLICNSAKVVLALPILISFTNAKHAMAQEPSHEAHHVSAQLVRDVRRATERFLDVNNTGPAGYGPAFGCVTGPDHGAMGIHYVNGPLVGDGKIELEYPEALIYEPVGNARKLVGVEYIVDAATWMKYNPAPPTLDGQDFQFVAAPNRFQLPDFFELHVWAWRDNPNGAFVDWNNKVTCEQLHVQEE
jgi:hypothetical protein